ncbi:hypothetical protein ACSQ67_007703 [Phaseolus vulgaris]
MPSTLGYNLPNTNSSSSKLSSLIGERSDQLPQSHTLVFSDPPQTNSHHHRRLNPLILFHQTLFNFLTLTDPEEI